MLVGSAGLGRMGRPMARHLAVAGHPVIGYDPAVPAGNVSAELRGARVEVTDEVTRLGLELAREHGLGLPVAATVGRGPENARAAGLADRDMAEVRHQLRDRQEEQ